MLLDIIFLSIGHHNWCENKIIYCDIIQIKSNMF